MVCVEVQSVSALRARVSSETETLIPRIRQFRHEPRRFTESREISEP